MSRDRTLYLRDIEERCILILSYTYGMDSTSFLADQKTIDAVERSFQIIGDAIKSLTGDVLDREPAVPWSLLARFRDVVTHAYFRLDRLEVWSAVTDEIPPLLLAVRRMQSESA